MLGLNPNISVITLNISRPDTIVKIQRLPNGNEKLSTWPRIAFQAEGTTSAKAQSGKVELTGQCGEMQGLKGNMA